MASHRKQRLGNANARYAVLMLYMGGNDLAFSRANAQREVREGRVAQFPTYTQAHKALKLIPREVRERYEREVRGEARKLVESVERQRKALRSTDIPSQQNADKKSRKQAKREAKGAQSNV